MKNNLSKILKVWNTLLQILVPAFSILPTAAWRAYFTSLDKGLENPGRTFGKRSLQSPQFPITYEWRLNKSPVPCKGTKRYLVSSSLEDGPSSIPLLWVRTADEVKIRWRRTHRLFCNQSEGLTTNPHLSNQIRGPYHIPSLPLTYQRALPQTLFDLSERALPSTLT